MHGQNKVRPFAATQPPGSLQVHEIWYTIQGEGPFFGMPAVFIRLTGCNLQCHFCDTEWNDDADAYLDVPDIVETVVSISGGLTKLVVLTGGEPTRQPLWLLIDQLKAAGFMTQIETAGTYWQECLKDESVTLVCSPKTRHVHPKIQHYCKHWKYVIRRNEISDEDGLPNRATQLEDFGPMLDKPINFDIPVEQLQSVANQIALDIARYDEVFQKFGSPARPLNKDVTIWLSPCDEGDYDKTDANVRLVGKLALEYGYRAQVQLHKLLEVD